MQPSTVVSTVPGIKVEAVEVKDVKRKEKKRKKVEAVDGVEGDEAAKMTEGDTPKSDKKTSKKSKARTNVIGRFLYSIFSSIWGLTCLHIHLSLSLQAKIATEAPEAIRKTKQQGIPLEQLEWTTPVRAHPHATSSALFNVLSRQQ